MAQSVFRAGAATSNISPALGTSINGNMQDKLAEHIHDELHARCLVLDDSREQVALAVCDLCMIPLEAVEAIKEQVQGFTGLPTDRILISATHTHSAATATGVFQSEPDPNYVEYLILRVRDGLRRAYNNLEPARAGWGVGSVPQHVNNRRWRMKPGTIPANPFGDIDRVQMNPPPGSENLLEPSGPIDPEVVLLSVQTAAGLPLAVLANYSLHYVGGTGPAHVSADYFGLFADELARALRPDTLYPRFVGIMSNGTSGNINNTDFRNSRARLPPYEQMRVVAHDVAREALRVIHGIEHRGDVTLDMAEARVTVARRLPMADEVARAKFILGQGEGEVLTAREEIYARETLLMADWPATKETVVQAIRVGGLGIAALGCETFVETGLAIKQQSPLRPSLTISLANDYAGYLPTPEHHALGGYETWRARSSYLAADAEPRLRATAIELLGRVAASA